MDKRGFFWLVVSLTVVTIFGIWCAEYSAASGRDWFLALRKPPLYPSDALLGVVWPILYVLMAVAAWLLGMRASGAEAGPIYLSLAVYGLTMALQIAWCYVFFVAQRFGWATLVMGLCWAATMLTLVLFWRARPLAGALLLPLAAWMTFAAYLSLGIAYHHSEFLRQTLRRIGG